MGLDIVAYSNLVHAGHTPPEWCEDDGHIAAYAYDSFPQSFRGITVTATEPEFLKGGCFKPTSDTETHSFRAGSYGGYNRWRQDLQDQFNPNRAPDAPFYELIWFADNEGTIGPDAAADLAEDFRQFAKDYIAVGEGAQRVFDDFAKASELASRNGLIVFA